MRENLNRISQAFFGKPADQTPDEPFPGFLNLVRPFERDMNANANFREVIDRQLEELMSNPPTLGGSLPGPLGFLGGALDFISPLGVRPILPGVFGLTGGLLFELGRRWLEKQQEEFDTQVDALLRRRSALPV